MWYDQYKLYYSEIIVNEMQALRLSLFQYCLCFGGQNKTQKLNPQLDHLYFLNYSL